MSTTIGTWNCRVGTPLPHVRRDLQRVLEPCDILGLQEWGGKARVQLLRSLDGYDFTKPHPRSGPVVWDGGRYAQRHVRDVVAAEGRRVGRIPGLRTVLEDYHVTVVELEDRTDYRNGEPQVVVVINCHAPVWRPGARARMHAEYMRTVTSLHRQYSDQGATVYTVGDWNRTPKQIRHVFAERAQAMSCWAHRKDEPTHGRRRTIDAIWNRCRPTTVDTIRTCSDHRAVTATY